MRSLKIYLIIGTILLIIYLVAKVNQPKAVDWTETLSSKDKIPYGTYILANRLNDIFPGARISTYRQPVYNVIAEDSIKQASYLIICPGVDFSQPDYSQLIKYLKEGNDVFISAEYFGKLFEKKLSIETKTFYNLVSKRQQVRYLSPNLEAHKPLSIDKDVATSYFSKFDTLHAVVLSENADHKANFIKYVFGKGNLYLCANPKLFSNYSLLKPDGALYAATALSFIKGTRQIILDEYYTQGDRGDDTPMRLFLSIPTLQWAYYIALFSLLVFVLYEIKRRQRIIPVIEPLSNATLDFVTVVGHVYYEQRDNADIAQKKILYLLTWLRDEHQIKTAIAHEKFKEKITNKLGLEPMFANELVNYLKYITVQEKVNDRELIELNKLIEKFYKQAR
ncbi:DUF4350 domain-containing protein [Mucilaginibacter xinganensis]|uniref:DUF4350 domain-containing protein n=1 Tax=Mucilaginibacter xinganensis TaxID=1234841 RepID=A0A223P1J3_9SPHI|nr:DUF4350 domain-containing protein [Mucilaginibacter xinganensis]ASU36019.1 hypothetical protein MuYL_4134 [Mucilaginibacter xinganensis]